ncbi:myomegalin-like [Sapajus apella]|uniref:Myomegalin-like n=1 Tax=Sapajus apella TaxID=9515 RepID=A0A6J3HDM1_SAPAP|nr:myomegalin-like [Sapajus apella]
MAKKERESQLELSALQPMMAVQEEELQVQEEELQVQEEELQVQAADMEPLTRKMQTKEDLIKDLQIQLIFLKTYQLWNALPRKYYFFGKKLLQ